MHNDGSELPPSFAARTGACPCPAGAPRAEGGLRVRHLASAWRDRLSSTCSIVYQFRAEILVILEDGPRDELTLTILTTVEEDVDEEESSVESVGERPTTPPKDAPRSFPA
ncbi:hypothetical protein AB1N83_008808 [Pleurotus pulmonarius]